MKKTGIFPLCCYCSGPYIPRNSVFSYSISHIQSKTSFNLNMSVANNHPHIFRYCP